MEIGSFIELQFERGKEYYSNFDLARLNSGRAAIYHAFRVTGCENIWLPIYQCDSVRNFLKKKNVNVFFYHINNMFEPIDIVQGKNDAVLLVNYFGIMSNKRMEKLSKAFNNVIIDNAQAFFSKPINNCLNVYSCRKFFGVPDGSYVIGKGASKYLDEYKKGYSSDTSLFLLQRIEYGCEGKTYGNRMVNEQRIDSEDVLKMSELTQTILDGTNYEYVIKKRRENFKIACDIFNKYNSFNPLIFMDNDCVPMVYPLIIESNNLLLKLIDAKHFQGNWWSYLLDEVDSNDFEYWISKNIIPITIDQRYGIDELRYILSIVEGEINE